MPFRFINQWPGGKPWKDSDTDSSPGDGGSDERVATPAPATANPVTTTPGPTVSPSKSSPAASDACVSSVASGWVQHPFLKHWRVASFKMAKFHKLPNDYPTNPIPPLLNTPYNGPVYVEIPY